MNRQHNEERLVLFSDAVIAITITLLAIELGVPDHAGKLPDADLWRAVLAMWPQFLAYGVSFAVIGIFWVSHHRKFAHITRVTTALLWINLIFLMAIGLVPFATSLVAESAGGTATALYAGVMSMVGIALSVLWAYARWANLIDADMGTLDIRQELLMSLLVVAVFLLSLPLALFSPVAAKWFWFLLVPINLARLGAAKRNKKAETE